ncbi:MAG: hypothetical protein ACK5YO_31195, partial [Planctomyces sp.]
ILRCRTARDVFERLLECGRVQRESGDRLARAWLKQWQSTDQEAGGSELAPWIDDHGWSELTDHSDLQRALDRRNFRQRAGAAGGSSELADKWQPVDKDVFCESGQAFGRVVFTTDAGLG